MVMPRSKTEIVEEEAKQPENVAARALGHKASEDINEFFESLQVAFVELARKELQVFLPHIKITGRKPGRSASEYQMRFTRGNYQAEEHAIWDLLVAAMNVYVSGIYISYGEHEIENRESYHGTPMREYLLRERIYALAQELLVKEKDDGMAEKCSEDGSED